MPDVGSLVRQIRELGTPRDWALSELAGAQHGVVATWQLLELGYSHDAIRRRIETGRLHRIHRGVYAVGHRRLGPDGIRMAAVLCGGEDALLSHRSAGSLWAIAPYAGSHLDVTVRHRRKEPEITWHRTRRLHPDDRAELRGIPVTSVARSLLDLAEVVNESRLERALEAAERLQLFNLRKVNELLERSRGRRGVKPLTALLGRQTDQPPETRSDLERDFIAFCDERGIDRPGINVLVEGYEVDGCWPEAKLIVELDSWEFHRPREAFERDRKRDTKLMIAGYRTVRVTSRRMRQDGDELETDIRGLLEAAA